VHTCAYACVCICVCMYACIVHVYMCVHVYVYVCVHVCIYIYMRARVGVHMHSCRRILFICTVQSLYYMRVYHRCFLTLACVGVGGLGVGFVPACSWLALVTGVGDYVLAGVEIGVLSVYFSIFAGIRVVGVCVLVYARTHTKTTWVLHLSPGVGRTPGGPEEFRSTKAQYTCRPYRCTQYICLYICCAAGFDDLG